MSTADTAKQILCYRLRGLCVTAGANPHIVLLFTKKCCSFLHFVETACSFSNVLMQNFIAEYIPAYRSMTKPEKGFIPLKVVLRIKQEGGYFLKGHIDFGWWFEVSDEAAREKISMSFRTANSVTSFRTDSPQLDSAQQSVDVDMEQGSKRMRMR